MSLTGQLRSGRIGQEISMRPLDFLSHFIVGQQVSRSVTMDPPPKKIKLDEKEQEFKRSWFGWRFS